MDCPACGGPNEDDALFCGSCGTTLDAAKDDAIHETLAEVTSAIEVGREGVQDTARLPEAALPRAQERVSMHAAAAKRIAQTLDCGLRAPECRLASAT